jgi:hypothetical protein
VLSNSLTAAAYNKGSEVVMNLYNTYGEAVKARLPLDQLNAAANGGLDFLEQR